MKLWLKHYSIYPLWALGILLALLVILSSLAWGGLVEALPGLKPPAGSAPAPAEQQDKPAAKSAGGAASIPIPSGPAAVWSLRLEMPGLEPLTLTLEPARLPHDPGQPSREPVPGELIPLEDSLLRTAAWAQAAQVLEPTGELPETELLQAIATYGQRLYSLQQADGSWGPMTGPAWRAWPTAHALHGLARAAQAGPQVEGDALGAGAAWLRAHLPEMDPPTRAYALYVLALLGQPEPGQAQVLASQVWAGEAELDTASRAMLVWALYRGGDDASAQFMLGELLREAVIVGDAAYWNEGMAKNPSIAATALVLQALQQVEPGHPLVPAAADWLGRQQRGKDWGTDLETAYALLALVGCGRHGL